MDSRKILLLSDGSEIFSVLDRVFTEAGYQTRTIRSRQGAVQALRCGDFHLVITRVNANRREPLPILTSIRRHYPGVTAIILRGEPELNSPREDYRVSDEEETFIPCGWPGLRRLVATCLRA